MAEVEDGLDGIDLEVPKEPPAKAASAVSDGLDGVDLEGLDGVDLGEAPAIPEMNDEQQAFVQNTIQSGTKLKPSAIVPSGPISSQGLSSPVPVPERQPDTSWTAKLLGGLQNATFGAAPYVEGRIKYLKDQYDRHGGIGLVDRAVMGPIATSGEPSEDDFIEEARKRNVQAREDNPYSSFALGLAGPGVATQSMKGLMAIGGIFGGVQGGLEAEEGKRAEGAVTGAVAGAAGGALLGGVFKGAKAGYELSKLGTGITGKLEVPVSSRFAQETLGEIVDGVVLSKTEKLLPAVTGASRMLPARAETAPKFKTLQQLWNTIESSPQLVPKTEVGTPSGIKQPFVAGVKSLDGQLHYLLAGTGDDLNLGIQLYAKPLQNADDIIALEKLLTESKNKGISFEVGVREWEKLPEQLQVQMGEMWKRVMAEGREEVSLSSTVGSPRKAVAEVPKVQGRDNTGTGVIEEPTWSRGDDLTDTFVRNGTDTSLTTETPEISKRLISLKDLKDRGLLDTKFEEIPIGAQDPDLPPVRPGAENDVALRVDPQSEIVRFSAIQKREPVIQGEYIGQQPEAPVPPEPPVPATPLPQLGAGGAPPGGVPPVPPAGPMQGPGSMPPNGIPPYGVDPRRLKVFENGPLKTAFRRFFSAPHNRLPADLGSIIMDAQSSKHANAAAVEFYKAWDQMLALKGTTRQRFGQALQQVAEGTKPIGWLEINHPEAFDRIRPVVDDALNKIDANQQWLISHGVVPAETMEKFAGKYRFGYLTRDYLAFSVPGYVDKLKKNNSKLFSDTIDWMIQSRGLAGPTPRETAEKILRGAISDGEEGLERLLSVKSAEARNPGVKVSMARSDVPAQLRKFLGENRDGIWGLAQTIAKQEALIQRTKVHEALLPYARTMADDLTGHVKVLDDPAQYGVLANKWLPAELHDAIIYLPNLKYEAPKVVKALTNWQKTMTFALGPPKMFVNMFVDNILPGIMSGGVDPLFRPQRTTAAFVDAVNDIYLHSKNPTLVNPLNLIHRMRKVGVDVTGHIGPSLDEINKRKVMEIVHNNVMKSGSYDTLINNLRDGLSKVKAGGSFAIDVIDRLHKAASFKMITEDLAKLDDAALMKEWGPISTSFMTREEMIDKLAARRIAKYFPMYDRLPAGTEMMRSRLGGIVGLASTFAMERNRVYAGLAKELAQGDFRAAGNLLKYGAAVTAMFGGDYLAKSSGALGVDEADVEMAMLAREGSWQQHANASAYVLPFRVNGKLTVMNFGPMVAPLAMLNGDPSIPAPLRAIISAGMDPFSGGAAGVAAEGLMSKAGIKPMFEPQAGKLGDTGGASLADTLNREGLLGPRVVTDAYNQVKSTGAFGSQGLYKDPQDSAVAALKFMGFPIEQTIDMEAFTGTKLVAIKNHLFLLKQGVNEYVKAKKMGPDRAAPMAQKLVELLGGDTRAENLESAAEKQIKQMEDWFTRWNNAVARKEKRK